MGDQSRRDVLGMLAGVIALPDVSETDLEGERQQQLPDVADEHVYWTILDAAARGDVTPDMTNLIPAAAPDEMDTQTAVRNVRAAAEGEYDDDVLARRAAWVWADMRGER